MSFLEVGGPDRARRNLIAVHEGDQPNDNRGDGPRWNPQLGVVVRKVRADSHVGLEAPVWGPHLDTRRLEGIVSWET